MPFQRFWIIAYLQGAAVPDETPNAETLEAFAELSNGGGTSYSGTTEGLFAELMGETKHDLSGNPA